MQDEFAFRTPKQSARSPTALYQTSLITCAVVACLASDNVAAGPIADLFRDGVFGVSWGASPAEVEAKLPGGKWQHYGDLRTYSVADGRAVISIERTPKQHIIFGFSTSGKLNGVAVEFPSRLGGEPFGNLLAKTREVFGPPLQGADASKPFEYSAGDVGGVTSLQVQWPADEAITVSITTGTTRTLFAVRSQLMLSIGYGQAEAATKEDLGFK